MISYNPSDWYWIVAGNKASVYSSARASFVSVSDETYQNWLKNSIGPTVIDSIESLGDVLFSQYPSGLSDDVPGPVPLIVTNAQARAVLLSLPGKSDTLFDDIDAVLKVQGGVDFMAWEYSNTISRNSHLVQSMAAQFGLSDSQLDAMFRQASKVVF